jgi:hypothetical protein
VLLFLVPIGAVALVVAELLRRRVRNYRAALGYSPRYNQRFTCDGSNTFVTPLVAVDDGYEWSVPQGSWDSVFVEILVEAGSLGSLLDPYVEVTLGHRTIRQYFERGASGLRIVNLLISLQWKLLPADGMSCEFEVSVYVAGRLVRVCTFSALHDRHPDPF